MSAGQGKRFRVRYIVGAVVLVLLAYPLLAVLLTFITHNSDKTNAVDFGRPSPEKATIYVVDNGIHMDILLPCAGVLGKAQGAGSEAAPAWLEHEAAQELNALLDQSLEGTHCGYLMIGWGQQHIFMEEMALEDIPLKQLLSVVFGRSDAVLRVYAMPILPAGVRAMYVGQEEYQRLVQFIRASFAVQQGGAPVLLSQNDNGARFYASNKRYDAIYTCNHWLNMALVAAGLKMPVWSPFVYGIQYQLNR